MDFRYKLQCFVFSLIPPQTYPRIAEENVEMILTAAALKLERRSRISELSQYLYTLHAEVLSPLFVLGNGWSLKSECIF